MKRKIKQKKKIKIWKIKLQKIRHLSKIKDKNLQKKKPTFPDDDNFQKNKDKNQDETTQKKLSIKKVNIR